MALPALLVWPSWPSGLCIGGCLGADFVAYLAWPLWPTQHSLRSQLGMAFVAHSLWLHGGLGVAFVAYSLWPTRPTWRGLCGVPQAICHSKDPRLPSSVGLVEVSLVLLGELALRQSPLWGSRAKKEKEIATLDRMPPPLIFDKHSTSEPWVEKGNGSSSFISLTLSWT